MLTHLLLPLLRAGAPSRIVNVSSAGQQAVDFDDVQTVVGDEVPVVTAFVTYKGLSADGTKLRAMNNRLTWGLRKTGAGRWEVVHEHSSAPVDFDTGKVDLQRRASG